MAAFPSDWYQGRRILFVGCAQGHGASLAKSFAAVGAELYLLDHNNKVIEVCKQLRELGTKVEASLVDVAEPSSLKSIIDAAAGDRGFDGLIYVPRGRVKKTWDMISPEDWDQDLDVGLRGAFFAAQACVPHLVKTGGTILFLSSVLSTSAGGESVGYHAAKGGLDSLTRYLALHLAPKGIRVNAVQMGWIVKDQDWDRFESPDNQSYRTRAKRVHPLGRVGRAQDLADALIFLGSGRAGFITGQVLCVDGGLSIQEHVDLSWRMSAQTE